MPFRHGLTPLLVWRALVARSSWLFLLLLCSAFWSETALLVCAGLLPVMAQVCHEWSPLKLLQECAQHPQDEARWAEFKRRFHEHLRGWALQALRRFEQKEIAHYREAVEDMVQNVYVRLVQNQAQALRAVKGRTDEEIFGYLRTITQHVVLNHLRRNAAQKRPRLAYSLDEETAEGHESRGARAHPKFVAQALDEAAHLFELRECLDYYLDALLRGPKKHRDIMLFQLHYYDGLSIEELAEFPGLKLSRHTIEVALNRVRHRLAQYAKHLQS